jgi:predicted  nucleic acid-binding Zn-ribbon protein
MLDNNDLQQLRALFKQELSPLLAPILMRLDGVDARLDNVEVRLDAIEFRLADLEIRVAKLENEVRELRDEVRRTRQMENEDIGAAYVEIKKLDRRVSTLETKVDKIIK